MINLASYILAKISPKYLKYNLSQEYWKAEAGN